MAFATPRDWKLTIAEIREFNPTWPEQMVQDYFGRQEELSELIREGVGEANTSSNKGAGVRLALGKEGVDLPFRTLLSENDITLKLTSDDEIIIGNVGSTLPLCEAGDPGDCLQYGVTTPVVNCTEIYNDTAWGNWPTAMKSGITHDGVIAVNGDVIFQSTATGNNLRPAGPLFVSTDFGDNWVTATNPVDTIWQDLDLDQFNTQYPDNLGHWGMQFVQGNFISLYGTWDLKIAASFVSSDNGQTWNLIYSSKRLAVSVENPYTGVYSKLGRSPGNLTINGVQPIFAGETSKGPAIQRGGWDTYGTLADSSPLFSAANNWSADFNYIAPMSPSYYVMVGQDSPGRVHLLDEAEQPRREYSAPYWTGTQWNTDYVGSWIRSTSSPNRNTLTYTTFDVSNGGGSTDGKHFVIPRTNWANFGNDNAGIYRMLTTPDVGGTGTKPDFLDLDLNPYLVTEPEDTTLYSLYLVYDKVFRGWLLIYSFRNPFAPKHFYMRAFHDPSNIAMSDVVKVVLPQPLDPEQVEMGYGDFGLAIKYSNTQDSFVISTLMTSSPSGYTLRTSKFANPFFCSLYEGGGGFAPQHDDILQYDSTEMAWCTRDTLLSLVEAGYGGISWQGGPVDFPAASPGNVIDANWYTLITDTLSVATPINVTQNITNDSLSAAKDGVWVLSLAISFGHNSDGSANPRNIGLRLFNTTDSTVIRTLPLSIGRNSNSTTHSINRLFELPAESIGDEVVVQIGGGDTLTEVQLYTFSYGLTRQNAYQGIPPP